MSFDACFVVGTALSTELHSAEFVNRERMDSLLAMHLDSILVARPKLLNSPVQF